MKIIFLDFDGVIRIPDPAAGPGIEGEFCPERMARVSRLARAVDAIVVVTSDWRHRFDRDGMIRLLSPHIPSSLLHEDWMSPILASGAPGALIVEPIPRGAEILSWLARHPEVESFVILDDMHSKHFPLMQDRLVSCNLLDGFTEKLFEDAVRVFRGRE